MRMCLLCQTVEIERFLPGAQTAPTLVCSVSVCVCVKASTSCILECSRYKVKGKEVVVGCGVPNVYFGEQFIFEASGTVSALHDY